MEEDSGGATRISIIMPAHNEAQRIGGPLEAYATHFSQRHGDAFEILVVANNCRDTTEEVVGQLARRFRQIHQVVIQERIGKGGAIIEGIKRAQGMLIGFVDADGSTPPEEFDRLVSALGASSGVIGSRWIKGALVPIPQSSLRRVLSRGFNLLVRLLFGFPYHDTQCGAKVFTRESLAAVVDNLRITDYAFDVNLLYLLRQKGCVVQEAPICWYDREGSQLRLSQVVPRMFAAAVQLRLKTLRLDRFLP